MLGLLTVVSIIIFLGLVSVASESEATILVALGLTVAGYAVFRPGSRLNHRHRILIQKDFVFHGTPLSKILDRKMFDLIIPAPHQTTLTELAPLPSPLDLLVLFIDFSDPTVITEIREIRRSQRIRQVPIIGVVAAGGNIDLDIRDIRSHGIVSLISEDADREVVGQSIRQAVGSARSKRLAERIDCLVPVEVASDRRQTMEHVTNLSVSGMRMTSENRHQIDLDVHLSFRLPLISEEPIRATGRVVYRTSRRNSGGCYEVGVRFHYLDPRSRRTISSEISRLVSLECHSVPFAPDANANAQKYQHWDHITGTKF